MAPDSTKMDQRDGSAPPRPTRLEREMSKIVQFNADMEGLKEGLSRINQDRRDAKQ